MTTVSLLPILLCLATGMSQMMGVTGQEPCIFNGVSYPDGSDFNDGCTASCHCYNGQIGCVSMCPPTAYDDQQNCREISLPGQCCPILQCDEVPKNKG